MLDLINKKDSQEVIIGPEYSVITLILQILFLQYMTSDINFDFFNKTDIVMITWRKDEEYIRYILIKDKETYTKIEKSILNYYKDLKNIKIIKLKYSPFKILELFFPYFFETKDNTDNIYINHKKNILYYDLLKVKELTDKEKDTIQKYKQRWFNIIGIKGNINNVKQSYNKENTDWLYDYLKENDLLDLSFYIDKWYVPNKEDANKIDEIKIWINNRLNIGIATRQIEEHITKIFFITLRPIYTGWKFDSVLKWMLSLKKIEGLIYDFFTKDIYKHQPDFKVENIGKIINYFFQTLWRIWLVVDEDDKELFQERISEYYNNNYTEEQIEDIKNGLVIFPQELKNKDDVYKYLYSIESGSGIALITWPTWSGKTTFLMTWLQSVLQKYNRTVITLEDPIEFLLHSSKSLIYQREVGKDIVDFISGIKDALREKPDIIVLGEIRENKEENIASILIETAKTWHLVLWTLHANNLYDAYKRFSFLANQGDNTDLQITYIINLRKINTSKWHMVIYQQYMWDKAKGDQNLNEIKDDKWNTSINVKWLILYLLKIISLQELMWITTDTGNMLKMLWKIASTLYISNNEFSLFSNDKEELDRIQANSND